MTITRRITSTLETRLAVMPNVPAIKWPGVKFDQLGDDIYLQPFVIRGANNLLSLSGGLTDNIGIYQVNVVGPRSQGAGAVETIADNVAMHFAADRKLNGMDILDITPNAAVEGDVTYTVPVSITYRLLGKWQ